MLHHRHAFGLSFVMDRIMSVVCPVKDAEDYLLPKSVSDLAAILRILLFIFVKLCIQACSSTD